MTITPEFSSNIETIAGYVFNGCTVLESITIPSTVEYIGGYAFDDCDSLHSIYCKPTTPLQLDNRYTFDGASDLRIYVPTASLKLYQGAEHWEAYYDILEAYAF